MTVAELKEKVQSILNKLEDEGKFFDRIGIRTQCVPFELGAIDHISHRWDDGYDTGEELPGLCVTGLFDADERVVEEHLNGQYSATGEYTAIIGGDFAEYGEDLGELILDNAEVICTL